AGVGLEVRALARRVVPGRADQTDHAGLNQVVDIDVRGQPGQQVVRDALDELRVRKHELVERLVADGADARILVARAHPACPIRLGPASIRSTKNSSPPLGARGGRQPSTLRASFTNARADALLGK